MGYSKSMILIHKQSRDFGSANNKLFGKNGWDFKFANKITDQLKCEEKVIYTLKCKYCSTYKNFIMQLRLKKV